MHFVLQWDLTKIACNLFTFLKMLPSEMLCSGRRSTEGMDTLAPSVNFDCLDRANKSLDSSPGRLIALPCWMLDATAQQPPTADWFLWLGLDSPFPVGGLPRGRAVALNESRRHFRPWLWKSLEANPTNMKQCWFLGSYADVGGGNKDSGLALLSFLWMIAQLKNNTYANSVPSQTTPI